MAKKGCPFNNFEVKSEQTIYSIDIQYMHSNTVTVSVSSNISCPSCQAQAGLSMHIFSE